MSVRLLSELVGQPVVAETAGGAIGDVVGYVLDPNKGSILAWKVQSGRRALYLVPRDIRFVLIDAIMVADAESLVDLEDLSRVQEAVRDNIRLNRLKVRSEAGRYLGRVIDALFDTTSWHLTRVHVRPPLWRRIALSELIINRDQVVRIERKQLVVRYDTKAPILEPDTPASQEAA